MRRQLTFAAILCVGGTLALTGCNQSGSDSGEATAKTASATTEQAAESKSTESAVKPSTLAAADDHEGHDHAGHDHDHAAAVKSAPESADASMVRADRSGASSLSRPSASRGTPKSIDQPNPSTGELTVRAEPEALDLGEIPTGDSKTGTVKLVNFGSDPVKIIDCKSSCGCTAAKCPRNKIIDPGQSVEVEIKMSAANTPQHNTKVMRFMIEGQPQLPLSVTSESVSYVLADPWTIDRDKDQSEGVETGTVTLTAKDNEPFRVLRMHPPIVEEFDADPATEHEIKIDWTRWEELGSSRRLTFYTDHAKCDKLFVSVQAIFKPVQNRDNKLAQMQPQPNGNVQPGGALQPGVNADQFVPPTSDPAMNPVNLIKAGDADTLLSLIDDGTIGIDEQDRTGATLLSVAAQNGKLDIVHTLIDLGADVEARDRIGKTPLMWAGHAKNVEVINALLNAGADIRARDNVVGTALSWTSAFGDGASVRALIEAGSDVNVAGTMGFTPLIWASLTGEADSVNALLEAGADAEVKDMTPAGSTPLMHASQTGKVDNVKALIEHGAKLEATDRDGKTALLIASEKSGGDVDTVRALVEAGADITATDLRGRNALDLANTRTDPRAPAVVEYLQSILTPAETDEPNTD